MNECLPNVILLPPPKSFEEPTADTSQVQTTYCAKKRQIFTSLLKTAAVLFSVSVFIAVLASGISSAIDEGLTTIFTTGVFSDSIVSYSGEAGKLTPSSSSGKVPNSVEPNEEEVRIPLKAVDHSASSVYDIYNETSYTPSTEALLNSFVPKSYEDSEPLVLVIHTHATESYRSENETSWLISEGFRSNDINSSVVEVGQTFCDTLEACGIKAIHITEQFDLPAINEAYDKSGAFVQSYLAEHPNINYVFDLHRDALLSSTCEYLAPTFRYENLDVAEVMLVVGTDEAGAIHPTWQDNLSYALTLQSTMIKNYPGLARGYNLRCASFNQQLSAGFLLAEIGSCANTLTESKRAAVLLAASFANTIGYENIPTTDNLLALIK